MKIFTEVPTAISQRPGLQEIDKTLVEVFDMSRLMELFGLDSADDIHMLSNLIKIFLEDTAKSISKLKQALTERNADIFMRAAHSIKGSSATIGAMRMAAISAELERLASADSLDKADGVLSGLEKEFERVSDLLKSKQLEMS